VTIRVFGTSLLPASARKPRGIIRVCRRVLKNEKADADGEINVVFLDRRRMRILNKRFLGHDRDTDVIAFTYAEDAGPVRGEKPFGDIFISAFQARRQAAEQGQPVLAEVLFLAAHGTLHLLGYDDSTSARRAAMFRKQACALPARLL
jgi:probable rRNA maturation factor